jgi:hypothetical protein
MSLGPLFPQLDTWYRRPGRFAFASHPRKMHPKLGTVLKRLTLNCRLRLGKDSDQASCAQTG